MKKTILLLFSIFSSIYTFAQLKGPTGLKGQQINLENRALIDWTASVDTVSGYKIYFKVKGATKSDSLRLGLVNSGTLSALKTDTVYIVKMRSFRAKPGKDTTYSVYTDSINVIIAKPLVKPFLYLEPNNTTQNKILLRLRDTNRYETGFEVKFEGGSETLIETVGKIDVEKIINKQNLKPKTTYKISARAVRKIDASLSYYSDWTNIIYETTKVDIPPQAVGLKQEANCPFGNILSWTIGSRPEDISSIKIYSSWNGITYDQIATLNAHERSYLDHGAQPGANWHYKVVTENATGQTTSSVLEILTKNYIAPNLPINIKLVPQTNILPGSVSNYVVVSWEHGIEDLACKNNILANTEIFKKVNGSDLVKVGDFPNYMTQINIEGFNFNDEVEVLFRTHSDKGKISDFTSAKVTMYGPPSAPNNFIGVLNKDRLGDQVLYLSWNKTSDNTESYLVEKSTDGINFSELTFLLQQYTNLPDTRVDEGVSYYYRIKARNWTGYSNYSTVIGPFFISYTSVPNAPYGLLAKKNGNGVDITWVDDSIKEEFYVLEKSSDGGVTFVKIAERGRNTTLFRDENISEGKTYIYRVKATNPLGSSAYSNPRIIAIPASTSSINFEVTVYPNPVAAKLNIQIDDTETSKEYLLRIYDANSKLIIEKKTTLSEDRTIDMGVSGMNPGIYNLTITNETGTITKKIVKL